MAYDYGFRIYNPAIGKFLSVDPLTASYPWYTPYQFAGNNPIEAVDLDGLEELSSKELSGETYRPGAIVEQKGNQYQYQGDGKWQQVYSGETRQGTEYSTKDLWGNLPEGYNSNSGYTYTKQELELRYQLLGSNTPISRYIQLIEKNGAAEPLTNVEAEIYYGGTNQLRMVAFGRIMGEALMLSGGAQSGARQPVPKKLNAINVAPNSANLTKASVNEKLERYLLNPDHPVGGSKAKWFKESLGFTKDNAARLADQIKFDPNRAVQTAVTPHGVKYNQVIPVTGANGRTIDVNFGWIKNNDGVVRLVTGIPTKK